MIEGKLGTSNIITNFIAYITGTIGGPIISFFKKNGFAIALGILGFVFLFKIGEAFMGRMSIVFYKEIGFSKGQIAIYSKGLGWITQYALLASIGTAGRTTLASSSGALVDWLNGDWGTFFVLTTIMVIPSLICLWMIKNKIKIGAK